MKYFVIGSEGFLGKALCKEVNKLEGAILVRADAASSQIKQPGASAYYQLDLSDTLSVIKIIKQESPDVIFCLAGMFGGEDLSLLFEVNCFSIIRILEKLGEIKTRIVLIGSAAEYGVARPNEKIPENHPLRPIGRYGMSKACMSMMATDLAKEKMLDVMIARIFNMSGSGVSKSLLLGAIASQIAQIEKRALPPVLKVGNTETYRDFLPVGKVASALIKLSSQGKRGETYNVCSGFPRLIRNVISDLLSFSAEKISVEVAPLRVKANDVPWSVGDNSKLIDLFNPDCSRGEWMASLRETLEYARNEK